MLEARDLALEGLPRSLYGAGLVGAREKGHEPEAEEGIVMVSEPSGDVLTRAYRIYCAVMAAVFVLSAAVQWNDPDPAVWIAFYGLAALTAIAALAGARWLGALEVGLAVVALGVVLAFVPALGEARIEALTSIEMKSAGDEEVRELGGAAIVLVFAVTLLVRRARRAN